MRAHAKSATAGAVTGAILCAFGLPALVAAEATQMTAAEGYGPNPQLPAPAKALIPTVNIAPARPWQGDELPTAASGLAVSRYACELDHPRRAPIASHYCAIPMATADRKCAPRSSKA